MFLSAVTAHVKVEATEKEKEAQKVTNTVIASVIATPIHLP
jgi:hypothetical protein